ncbi:trypsin-like peptidase domain-containing protein [Tolypothrix sp. PCC 7910]|uniref:S1 family peptidase n=1 Tax=Tolypothrix sp. PCC 7910 TaxID=2099387 RepID=UPI0014278F0F|nr:serine protease [Tolypothrix sp. PCC 7910]QIR39270.1 trypsin-like peptidase domain-containing protein [Tolypothrix sp. PCC 7910]
MKLATGLAILFGTAIFGLQTLVVAGLSPEEIAPIAKQITVRIDGANSGGSGVIIDRQGNGDYTVLTNWHVVQIKDRYIIQTMDGQKYNIDTIKQLPGVDLAELKFKSGEIYPVAKKGNSDQLTSGKTIYVGGYPKGIPGIPGRQFQYLSGSFSGRVPNPQNGYSLIYIVEPFPGMSGGPILDENGRLVGINGRAGTVPDGGTAVLGIPINIYSGQIGGRERPEPPEGLKVQCQNGNVPNTILNPKDTYLEGELIVVKFANACPGKTILVVKKAGSRTGLNTGYKERSELVKEYEGELSFYKEKLAAGRYEVQAYFRPDARNYFFTGSSRSFSVTSRF